MTTIEQFKTETGFYDEAAILQAAGVAERAARFTALFGDVQGAHEIETNWQALLDEARRLNQEMMDAAKVAQTADIAAALAANNWRKLKALGAAQSYRDDEDQIVYELTDLGYEVERGLARQNTAADYADQLRIEG
jgi:hypothetical protein